MISIKITNIMGESYELEYIRSFEYRSEEDKDDDDDFCDCVPMDNPVCGSDGVTYKSKCKFMCAADKDSSLRILHLGSCDEKFKRNSEKKFLD